MKISPISDLVLDSVWVVVGLPVVAAGLFVNWMDGEWLAVLMWTVPGYFLVGAAKRLPRKLAVYRASLPYRLASKQLSELLSGLPYDADGVYTPELTGACRKLATVKRYRILRRVAYGISISEFDLADGFAAGSRVYFDLTHYNVRTGSISVSKYVDGMIGTIVVDESDGGIDVIYDEGEEVSAFKMMMAAKKAPEDLLYADLQEIVELNAFLSSSNVD